MNDMLRDELVKIALQWQAKYGVAPQITTVVSEYDAAMLVGMPENDYSEYMQDKTAVNKGSDFVFNHTRYQVKANRPSGKPGSFVTMVPKASNYEWDKLIWILYDKNYVIQEAWEWCREEYILAFDSIKRLSPNHYRKGRWAEPLPTTGGRSRAPVFTIYKIYIFVHLTAHFGLLLGFC